ncbi:uncharacterized protein ARMOST_15964 [Armillaria ostoyae]|uniref:Uncharacterized protein n=1 Tax=Armillaria ostoyae TaxID=47428 RepID=A0A284RUU6_ARMOS|nr:uncharacterized protein ARMOST_15964 [Armillaria ostoyae]
MIESWPVVSCSRVCGLDSLEEEDVLIVKVTGCELQTRWGWLPHHMVHLTIPELNAEHGFDPARDGADVCEYFGWPPLEILDSPNEWTLIDAASQSSESASVMSDNTGQTSSKEHDSELCGMDEAMGSIEKEQAGEATTKTEIISVMRYDISTRALIVIFIAIGIQVVLLSSFKTFL